MLTFISPKAGHQNNNMPSYYVILKKTVEVREYHSVVASSPEDAVMVAESGSLLPYDTDEISKEIEVENVEEDT